MLSSVDILVLTCLNRSRCHRRTCSNPVMSYVMKCW